MYVIRLGRLRRLTSPTRLGRLSRQCRPFRQLVVVCSANPLQMPKQPARWNVMTVTEVQAPDRFWQVRRELHGVSLACHGRGRERASAASAARR